MAETNKICAVIELGSNSIFYKIAQKRGADIDVLENIEYNLSLGKDSFAKGKIEFEKVLNTEGEVSALSFQSKLLSFSAPVKNK